MIKLLLDEITTEVETIFETDFDYRKTEHVPNVESDKDLTFTNGKSQHGLELSTCVLFVDVRDSVSIKENHYHNTLGRLYTSFTTTVLRIAKEHNGHVRNIIGDRVMIVFDPSDCFKNSVECAVSINHVASLIIAHYVPEFRVGIGIDYGTMRVYKVGIIRKDQENAENKNLVWIGDTANFASRLTDMANKDMEKQYQVDKVVNSPVLGLKSMRLRYTANELAEKLTGYNSYQFNSIMSVDKIPSDRYMPIMITEDVFNGLKNEKPNCNSLKNGWWHEAYGDFRGVNKKVYQSDLCWDLN